MRTLNLATNPKHRILKVNLKQDMERSKVVDLARSTPIEIVKKDGSFESFIWTYYTKSSIHMKRNNVECRKGPYHYLFILTNEKAMCH